MLNEASQSTATTPTPTDFRSSNTVTTIQLAMMFQIIPEQMQSPAWLIQRLRLPQMGGGFHVKARIFQAGQGQGISCTSCFDSIIDIAPPVQSVFGTPVPYVPDQPVVALNDGSIVATVAVVPGGFSIVPLDGNTQGLVLVQAPGAMNLYFFAGLFYICLCVTIDPSVPNPAQLVVQNYTTFDLYVTGV